MKDNESDKKNEKTKVLIIGFFGMSDIGTEVRLMRIVEDLNLIRDNLDITVVTLLGYQLVKIPNINYINLGNISYLGVLHVFKIMKNYDIILIGEGIPFTNFIGSGFLLYFVPVLYMAKFFGKKTICYAIDVDRLSRLENYFLRRALQKSDLIITRTPLSKKIIEDMEIEKQIHVTADPVFLYKDKKLIKKYNKSNRLRIGVGFINHFGFPLKIKPFGDKKDMYKYPYYYSYKNHGKERYQEFVNNVSDYLNEIIEEFNAEIYFFAMDYKIDFHINEDIKNRIKKKKRVKLISYKSCSLNEINGIFSTLDMIISSRLHALILSTNFNIPFVAVRVDERFDAYSDYMGLKRLCLDVKEERFIDMLDDKIRYIMLNRQKHKRK